LSKIKGPGPTPSMTAAPPNATDAGTKTGAVTDEASDCGAPGMGNPGTAATAGGEAFGGWERGGVAVAATTGSAAAAPPSPLLAALASSCRSRAALRAWIFAFKLMVPVAPTIGGAAASPSPAPSVAGVATLETAGGGGSPTGGSPTGTPTGCAMTSGGAVGVPRPRPRPRRPWPDA
jgi:hypothetical protein